MAELEDNIKRTEEVQEILGTMPHWLIRWGTTIIVFMVLNLLLVAYFMKYPDSVFGAVTITCENPPAKLVARATGRISLLFKDKSQVKKDDIIAVIENTSNVAEILAISKKTNYFESIAENPLLLINDNSTDNHYNLGELQESYNRFKNNCEEYKLFVKLQQNARKIESFNKQLLILNNQKELFSNKLLVSKKEYEIAERQLKSDSILFHKNALSLSEKDKTEKQFIASQNAVNNIKEALLKNQEQYTLLNASIDDLFLTNKDQKNRLELNIKTSFKDYKTQLMLWQQKYFIKAPFDGTVSLFDFWNNNQVVNIGDNVAYVIAGSDNLFAKLLVTGVKFGKVKANQDVKIILDSYPAAEYGILFGKVESISEVNKDNMYAVNVSLPNGLVTSYKDTIEFRHEMKGYGEILTDDLNLLERVFFQLRALFISKRK